MGITHQHKLWRLGQAVAKGESLSDPRRWGGLPFELQKFKNIMPVLMHGKSITFANKQTKHSHSRRAFIPNIVYSQLYSSALGMKIWTCLSARALREMDSCGGFDEYVSRASPEKFGKDPVALMYKERILMALQAQKGNTVRDKMLALMKEKYGAEYAEKVEKYQNSFH